MGRNLYSFQSLNCTDAGAPRVIPMDYSGIAVNGNGFIKKDQIGSAGAGIVNVVNDFQWTTSPPGAASRQEVPRIFLTEKRLKRNALISAAAYYLLSVGGSIGTLSDFLGGGGLGSVGRSFIGATGGGSGLASLIANSPVGDVLNTQIQGLGGGVLAPYEGLYITEDTKFKYVFPYFTDDQQMLNNSFQLNDEMLGPSSLLGKTVSVLRDAAESAARITRFLEPGLYIERPRFFQFKSSGDAIRIQFPLINTGWSTFDDVRINWQLAYLLAYQNNPNRRTREVIDPPCIYEVSIPGIKYIPYAFIRNLNITYVGARRAMELPVPGAGTITTIVPDAYMFDITLEGLVADTQNFMQAAITSKSDLVNVTNSGSFNLLDEFTSSLGGGR